MQFRPYGLLSDASKEPTEELLSGKMRVGLDGNSSGAAIGATPTGFDSAALTAYGMTPVGKVASVTGLLPAENGGFSPSLPANIHNGHYLSALMQAFGIAPTGAIGKLFR
jgi:hypothetical protein